MREFNERMDRLQRRQDDLERRMEPSIKLYESLQSYGIDRYALPLLQWWAKLSNSQSNHTARSTLWNNKWTRWAAIAGILFIILQMMLLALSCTTPSLESITRDY